MREYHKIETVFERDERTKKLIAGKFRNATVEYLQNNEWVFTEKIDGTNIRVVWDGHRVAFYGRTDNAQIPSQLIGRLMELFGGEVNEQLFEQKFGEKEVMLIGEGYGAKIQKCGAEYRADQDFILFDVMVGYLFLDREAVAEIASYFGLDTVPVVLRGTIKDAVELVKSNPASMIGTAKSEGLVGRPMVEMQDRLGNRVIVKIKTRDFG